MTFLKYSDERIKRDLETLKEKDPKFYEIIANALRNIEEDAACGIKIPQRLIPKDWITKFKINNLYKYNLPNGWRLFYSLIGNEIEVIAIILRFMNHKEYERTFNY
jgi:hypothetical protein